MRITAYADRLLQDLEMLDWSEAIKTMQRNWIGKSQGAEIIFSTGEKELKVFTTRPDTLFGATYMVLAPEHPLLESIVSSSWPENTPDKWKNGMTSPVDAVRKYQKIAAQKSDLDRQENKQKTGVFVGEFATVPVNGRKIPVFISDYVLMGYGTGAIMAVPGQDERDWEFAQEYDLEIIRTVQPSEGWDGNAFTGDGPAINSDFLDGLLIDDAKEKIIEWLEETGNGNRNTTYKLRG